VDAAVTESPVTGARVVAVVGPTAVGKSALGIALAKAVDGEVVNADSMQLYRGMDIGTAKLRADEWDGVPHHLLDVWEVTRAASVADYQRRARAAVADIAARGRTPVLVGGSGLYIQATVDELHFPATDPGVRAQLEEELAAVGPAALHRRLAELDPKAAAATLPSNGRRVVRALEVLELTGTRFSDGPGMTAYRSIYPGLRLVGLELDHAALVERIVRRVDLMWQQGLVDEVRRLEKAGLRDGVTARRALGYQQVLAMRAGEYDDATARERTVYATRRFARRQVSWFRRDPRITWLPADGDALPRALALLP
jgi:tRNA dimethylallyltransferase